MFYKVTIDSDGHHWLVEINCTTNEERWVASFVAEYPDEDIATIISHLNSPDAQ